MPDCQPLFKALKWLTLPGILRFDHLFRVAQFGRIGGSLCSGLVAQYGPDYSFGYYFWDNHIDLAHHWGDIHCNGAYMICEGYLTVGEDVFLDLVGSRSDQIFIAECINEMPELKNLSVGEIIEFLKKEENKPNKKGIFPFKVIRAVDNTLATKYKSSDINFAPNRKGKMTINPQIMICMVTKNKLVLSDLKIIFPEKYANG